MTNKITPFEFKPFSHKQKKVLTWWCDNSPYRDYDGIICEGSIRSGKTTTMTVSFLCWAMERFSECNFALCGKTVGSLRRNVISTLKGQAAAVGMSCEEKRSENLLIISYSGTTNYFYLFGGKDEASQDLIQGITLAGIFFDEVALMPQSFVTQGEARCSVAGSKIWYNCNPSSPKHWFKMEHIDNAEKRFLVHLQFSMDDNLTLSEEIKERYKRSFTGVFYKRYILGLWVSADGAIYSTFTDNNIIDVKEWNETDENGRYINARRNKIFFATIGVDFGGYKSSHAFNCSAFTSGYGEIITVKERRIKETETGLTPSELENEFISFVRECIAEGYPVRAIYCDSAEQVLIRGFKNALVREKIPIVIKNARKDEILDRIRFYTSMMCQGRYFILSNCTETISAFQDAVWDDKHPDTRLDDGSTNIDSLDAQEYSTEPYMKAFIDMGRKYGQQN